MNYVLDMISLFINICAMLDIWLIMNLLFGCDMKITLRNMALALGGFVIVEIIISIILEGRGELTAVIIFAYNVMVTLILTRSYRIKTLLLTIPALLVYAQFGMFLNLVEKLTGLEKYYVMNQGEKLSPADFVSDALLLVLLVLLRRTKIAKGRSVQLTIGEGVLLSVFCAFSPVIVSGLEWFEGMANAVLYNLVWVLFMIVLNVAVVYAIAHRKKATYYQRLSEDYKKEFEAEYSFFKDYKEQQQDIIKFRHDWKNHMLLLQEMLENEEYEKAESYFRDLTVATSKPIYKIATGNELVDMILSTKMNGLEENEITLQCKGALSEFNFMKQVDCCILLSNLIDNAIEANEKVDGTRYILLEAKKTEQLFYLEIKNPMEGTLQQEDYRIVTTKEEKDVHGIGLQNVYDIIKKYNGEYHITAENQEYAIQMIFSV